MPAAHALTNLIELLQRAHRSQMLHPPGHDQAVRNLDALAEELRALAQQLGPFQLVVDRTGFHCPGLPGLVSRADAPGLARDLEAREVGGLEFLPGADRDELDLVLFMLQLKPQRLQDMGGPASLLPEDGLLRVLPAQAEAPAEPPAPAELPAEPPAEPFPAEDEPLTTIPALTSLPAAEAEPWAMPTPAAGAVLPFTWEPAEPLPIPEPENPWPEPLPVEPAPAPQRLSAEPVPPPEWSWPEPAPAPERSWAEPLPAPVPSRAESLPALERSWAEPSPAPVALPAEPAPADAPLPAAAAPAPEPVEPAPAAASSASAPIELDQELLALLRQALAKAIPVQRAGSRSPWGTDHREVMQKFGFSIADCSVMAGAGRRLGLDPLPPNLLHDVLRQSLAQLPPLEQGNILLGLQAFPQEEAALGRALDFLGPELLAQAVAYAHLSQHPSVVDLAVLTVALMQCVDDRDLTLEAIRGRLQFEGWGAQEVEELKEAVQWECQGTDTKVNLSLERHLIHTQDPRLVMTLGRQLIRTRRMDNLRSLVAQLEEELDSPLPERRSHGARIMADLAAGIRDHALGKELERRILVAGRGRLLADEDPVVGQWSSQVVEAVLGRWLLARELPDVQGEMVTLSEFCRMAQAEGWKVQMVRDLMARLASAANIELLLPSLDPQAGGSSAAAAHAILVLMGPPAATSLAARLEVEQDPGRRDALLEAFRSMGPAGVPALRPYLGSGNPAMVAQALNLLAKSGDSGILQDMVRCIGHPDPWVCRAAVDAVAEMAGRPRAAQELGEVLATAGESAQLDYLSILGELGEASAVPGVVRLLQSEAAQGKESQRLRLRAVEVLGQMPCAETAGPLLALFGRRGLFKGRESLAIRLAAARSLAANNTREARESMALALESEPQEEVRSVLRQFLVKG